MKSGTHEYQELNDDISHKIPGYIDNLNLMLVVSKLKQVENLMGNSHQEKNWLFVVELQTYVYIKRYLNKSLIRGDKF